jgi:hypothetical protein
VVAVGADAFGVGPPAWPALKLPGATTGVMGVAGALASASAPFSAVEAAALLF